MTEKRYFYTDPLAAAWMAKHFGMQFDELEYSGGERWMELNFAEKLYIHPDSLGLLKPQVGDYAMDTYGSVSYVKELKGDRAIGCKSELFDSDVCSIYVPRVLQRDGIPFHWPERKE